MQLNNDIVIFCKLGAVVAMWVNGRLHYLAVSGLIPTVSGNLFNFH